MVFLRFYYLPRGILGAVRLNKKHYITVALYPDGLVRKAGEIFLGQADAMRFARSHGLPVPHVHSAETIQHDEGEISMEHVEGDNLSEVWTSFSEDQKGDITQQLRDILKSMQSINPPPETRIGAYTGNEIRDTRLYCDFTAPSCQDETEFNDYLINALVPGTPPAMRQAFSQQLQTNHRVVFTHGNLVPRNIIVRDGRIVGLLGWDEAGWYPEYWEYVKYFQRMGSDVEDWWQYADDIFPESYPNELVNYLALSRYQWS